MKLLIAEDDENKRTQVTSFIRSNWPEFQINEAKSYQSSLRKIVQAEIDLIILDMTMPTFDISAEEDGGRPQAYAGRDILRQMARRDITIPVVVLTQFDKFGEGNAILTRAELDAQLRESHSERYYGMVYYDVALEGWKDALRKQISLLEFRLSTKEKYQC